MILKKIVWENNIPELPNDTINLINSLSEQVGAPTYIRTPSFSNNNNIIKNNFKKKKKKYG